jgi:hypothetical protein
MGCVNHLQGFTLTTTAAAVDACAALFQQQQEQEVLQVTLLHCTKVAARAVLVAVAYIRCASRHNHLQTAGASMNFQLAVQVLLVLLGSRHCSHTPGGSSSSSSVAHMAAWKMYGLQVPRQQSQQHHC